MLTDARQIPSGEIIDTEVCIIGAGPAGIAIARELNGCDFRVHLLESGGFEADPEIQSLAEDASLPIGDPYFPNAAISRQRIFGGTSTAWNIDVGIGKKLVRHIPLDPIDFEKRDWVPFSGWPITKQDLDPYYERAHDVCRLGPYNYETAYWEDENAKQIPFKNSRIRSQIFQFGPRDVFVQEYRRELEQSKNVCLCTYATVVELETDDLAHTVTQVKVRTLEGGPFWVKAKFVILAVGALEAPRLLLLSDRVQKTGLGNSHDLIGRFFMDHPAVRSGILVPPNRQMINSLRMYDARMIKGAIVMGKMVLTEETLRREKLLNICAALYPRPAKARFNPLRTIFPEGPCRYSLALESAKTLKQAIKKRKLPEKVFSHLINVISGVDDVLYARWRNNYDVRKDNRYHFDKGGWSKLEDPSRELACFEVVHFLEQVPDPDNRVMLSGETDRFGSRKLQIYWRITELDAHSVRKAQAIFADEFARAGLGKLKLEYDQGMPHFISPSSNHSIGTTRMHDNPGEGVVDAQCKVHSVSNLYIASSSVFTTGGLANPTLTIIALGLRIADHIKVRMAEQVIKTG